jgi:hypothetical protein
VSGSSVWSFFRPTCSYHWQIADGAASWRSPRECHHRCGTSDVRDRFRGGSNGARLVRFTRGNHDHDPSVC